MELAQSASTPELARTYLKSALDSVERATVMTRRLLAFAREQPGKPKSLHVEELLQGLLDLARPAIEESIEIRIDCPERDLWVHADQGQLEGALLNLVVNSRDAIISGERGDTIILSARALSAEGVGDRRLVEIAVTDNGPGMSEAVRSRATDPFFTTKSPATGTGLGLAMVYGFVQQAKGEFNVSSEPGVGSRMSLNLPQGMPEKIETVEPDEPENGQGERIFLVEDEAELRTVMEVMIEMLGYDVVSADSGKKALEMVESGLNFDLLLTDVVMPGGVGGFELARPAALAASHSARDLHVRLHRIRRRPDGRCRRPAASQAEPARGTGRPYPGHAPPRGRPSDAIDRGRERSGQARRRLGGAERFALGPKPHFPNGRAVPPPRREDQAHRACCNDRAAGSGPTLPRAPHRGRTACGPWRYGQVPAVRPHRRI